MNNLTRTLILTVALPDFYAEDLTQEHADAYFDGDMTEAVHEAMGLISNTARLFIMHGDRGGEELFDLHAVILSAEVVEHVPNHDEEEDERLTYHLNDIY